MAIPSVAFSRYLSGPGHAWRDDDYNSKKFIDAIKGKRLNKYARIPVRGRRYVLEQANAGKAVDWYAIKAFDFISAKKGLKPPFFFVPIPDSGCALNCATVPRMLSVAVDLAGKFGHGSEALDILRWKAAMQPTHQGGTREVAQLYKNMKVVGDLPDAPVVLIDDISTWGSHIRAAEARIFEKDGEVELALLAGETVWEQTNEVFGEFEREFEEYRP